MPPLFLAFMLRIRNNGVTSGNRVTSSAVEENFTRWRTSTSRQFTIESTRSTLRCAYTQAPSRHFSAASFCLKPRSANCAA